jgi:riboflavin-specific deaminase-like protein
MIEFSRLFPTPGSLTLEELRATLEFVPSGPDRPHTIANFVCTADGRAAFDGRSAPLSDAGDRAIFHTLRERVDAVIAGTNTLRTERYGRLIPKPETRARRLAKGLAAEPLACVVTRTGKVPTEIPLFSEREARIVVFAAAGTAGSLTDCAARVTVVELELAELTLSNVLRHLRADHEVGSLLCEGGPSIFGSLVHEALVDELFLTLAPKLTGGGHAPTITNGPELAELRPLEPVWLLEREGSVFMRYRLA